MLVFVMWKYFFLSFFPFVLQKALLKYVRQWNNNNAKKSPGFALFRSYDVAIFLFFFYSTATTTRERETSENFELARNWMIFMCFSSPRQQFLSGFSHYAAYSRENRVRFSDFFFPFLWLSRREKSFRFFTQSRHMRF